MYLRKVFLIVLLFIIGAIILISLPAFAENSWVGGLKISTGVFTLGLELEKQWSRYAILASAGDLLGKQIGTIVGFKWYFGQTGPVSFFFEPYGGFTIPAWTFTPFVGLGTGFEWRLDSFRVCLGSGFSFSTKGMFPIVALSAGIYF